MTHRLTGIVRGAATALALVCALVATSAKPADARGWHWCDECESGDAWNMANGLCGDPEFCTNSVWNCIVDDEEGMSFDYGCYELQEPETHCVIYFNEICD